MLTSKSKRSSLSSSSIFITEASISLHAMASWNIHHLADYALLISSLLLSTMINHSEGAAAAPNALFVFGDSYLDTGNLNKSVGYGHSWLSPYGKTYPGTPSGRFSDGRVFTDIFASALQMPSPVVPYEQRLRSGAAASINFAVGGSGVFNPFGMLSFRGQIDQFESLNYSHEFLQSSVALVGFHGNDYGAFLASGSPLSGLPAFQQSAVNELGNQLERLSKLGLRAFYVNNLQPVGCLPSSTFPTFTACIDIGNEIISDPHNKLVSAAIADLSTRLSGTSTFTLLDHYSAFNAVLQDPAKHGLGAAGALKPCCLGASDSIRFCGDVDQQGKPMFSVCNDAATSLFWDAIHPSQAGWIAITQILFPNAKLGPFSYKAS